MSLQASPRACLWTSYAGSFTSMSLGLRRKSFTRGLSLLPMLQSWSSLGFNCCGKFSKSLSRALKQEINRASTAAAVFARTCLWASEEKFNRSLSKGFDCCRRCSASTCWLCCSLLAASYPIYMQYNTTVLYNSPIMSFYTAIGYLVS